MIFVKIFTCQIRYKIIASSGTYSTILFDFEFVLFMLYALCLRFYVKVSVYSMLTIGTVSIN